MGCKSLSETFGVVITTLGQRFAASNDRKSHFSSRSLIDSLKVTFRCRSGTSSQQVLTPADISAALGTTPLPFTPLDVNLWTRRLLWFPRGDGVQRRNITSKPRRSEGSPKTVVLFLLCKLDKNKPTEIETQIEIRRRFLYRFAVFSTFTHMNVSEMQSSKMTAFLLNDVT